MTNDSKFDAREFGRTHLAGTVSYLDAADAEELDSLGWFSVGIGDSLGEAQSLDDSPEERAYALMGESIVTSLFNGPENTEVIIDKLNALLDVYAPEAQRWQATNYASFDDFWERFREDFAWGDWMAKQIVKLEDPNFVEYVKGIYEAATGAHTPKKLDTDKADKP